MRSLVSLNLSFLIFFVGLISACANQPADVNAKAARPTKTPNQSTDPLDKPNPEGPGQLNGRIFCIRGQVKSSLATFSTKAAADVFASSLVFKKDEFPLVDLNDFEFLGKSDDQIRFVLVGEATNPSDTSDVSKKVSAHIISSRLLNRESEIQEILPIIEHPSAMTATLESLGYRLNRVLVNQESGLKVYGLNKDNWILDLNGKNEMVLSSAEYFNPQLYGKWLYFFKLEKGLVSIVKISLDKPDQLIPVNFNATQGSILDYAVTREGLLVLQKEKEQYSLNLMNTDEKISNTASWQSNGRVWLNSDINGAYVIVEDMKTGFTLSQLKQNSLVRLGPLQVDGEVKDVLSYNQNQYAIIKDKGVNRIYRISSNEKQQVISRSECERAWIVKW